MADIARQIVKDHFRQNNLSTHYKDDQSPVTIADRAIEATLREMIEQNFPDDGLLGEEFGEKQTKNGLTWVIDPIDGTKSFIAGRPSFGTLISLCENDIPVMGIIDQPILHERWIGAQGQGTTFNGQPVSTVSCGNLSTAKIASTSPDMFSDHGKILTNTGEIMIWGGDCYSYGLLANGWIDVVVESDLKPYDFAALAPIITGAGGTICDWNGHDLTLQSDGRVIAMGDKTLKDSLCSLTDQLI